MPVEGAIVHTLSAMNPRLVSSSSPIRSPAFLKLSFCLIEELFISFYCFFEEKMLFVRREKNK